MHVTANQSEFGKVCWVHVIPSVDEAPVAEREMATKRPVVGLTVTDCHKSLAGRVRAVQVIPSVEEAAALEL